MLKSLTLALGIALAFPWGSQAVQSAPSDVWGAPIMKQPFDREPLREIRIPEWVERLSTVTYCFSVMDDGLRKRAAEAGVQLSELNFVDPYHAHYESKLLKRRDPNVPPGKLEKDLALYRKLGVKVLGVVPPPLQAEVCAAHPGWRRVWEKNGEVPGIPPGAPPHGLALCQLGPWGDHFIHILEEIVTRYPDVAAFSFDGLHDYGSCYCESCREAFLRDTGLEIPGVDMNDPLFRRYQHWLDRRMESFVERIQTRLKTLNPRIALITWSTNAGRFGHFLSIPRNMPARMNLLFDAPDQEFWMDETNRGNTVVPAFANAYLWAVTNHRVAFSSPYVMSHGNPYGADSFPPQELLRRALLVLTYGPRPSCALAGKKPLIEATLQCMQEAKAREPWLLGKEPEPWAAMVMSDNTRTFYGRDPGKVEERYLSNVFGVFRTSIEEHLPMTVINDWNLNPRDLARYRVLVLPNTACMNEEQAEAVREFVKEGGGLVASVDTSLHDEMGNPRRDFLLADLFGVRHQGAPPATAGVFDLKLGEHAIFDLPRMKEYLPDGLACFKGQAVPASTAPDVPAIATITSRDPGGRSLPSVVARSSGRGKVAYLAAGFDSAYYLYPYPYHRLILAGAMRWAAAEEPPIAVEAPMCVHSTFYRQKKDGERLVVHLYNDLNTTGNHARPDDDVPLREEVVPIRGIRVVFKGYQVSRVHLEPGGRELEMEGTPERTEVAVPELAIHAMVVAELR